jgi:hypothetical protein
MEFWLGRERAPLDTPACSAETEAGNWGGWEEVEDPWDEVHRASLQETLWENRCKSRIDNHARGCSSESGKINRVRAGKPDAEVGGRT